MPARYGQFCPIAQAADPTLLMWDMRRNLLLDRL
jgi:hypothetical protein